MKERVTSALGVEFETEFDSRAGDLIVSSMCDLITSGNYKETDIVELLTHEDFTIDSGLEITYLGASNDFTDDPNILAIMKIYERGSTLYGYRYIEKTQDFIVGMNSNSYLEPVTGVYYYYLIDDVIRFANSSASGKTITVKFVRTPDTSDWTGEMIGLYSLSFLERVINMAIERLSAEVDR